MLGKKKLFCMLMLLGIVVTTLNIIPLLMSAEVNTFSEFMERFSVFNFVSLFVSILLFYAIMSKASDENEKKKRNRKPLMKYEKPDFLT